MTELVGGISLAQERLRQMVANCPTFQTWTGAETVEQALSRVYHLDLPEPENGVAYNLQQLKKLRPFAVVATDPDAGYTETLAGRSTWVDGGELFVGFEQDVPNEIETDLPEIFIRFTNTMGSIIDDLKKLIQDNVDFRLDIRKITFWGPDESKKKERAKKGHYVTGTFVIEWGSGR
ncbi:MAG: hypothetical protein MI923_20375 [Phycisphaerales bacterium]|nr:hypothetical protein [Phycisphaerales bacterium]